MAQLLRAWNFAKRISMCVSYLYMYIYYSDKSLPKCWMRWNRIYTGQHFINVMYASSFLVYTL